MFVYDSRSSIILNSILVSNFLADSSKILLCFFLFFYSWWAIKSIFTKTDSNWKIMAVECKQSDNNSTVTSNGGNGNGIHQYFNGTNANSKLLFFS